ncbi:MAG: PEGA domain-containing protein [Labilithrix sp.]|nr:PEGA domain-containing protein [Labilithrix sp.]MCW5817289.1 PEGA domain-containing protein [Labilithrix sp.]
MRTGYVLVLSLSLCSCAAVFRGSKESVQFESNPAGAEANMGPRKLGATPKKVDIERNGTTQITMVKAGYEDHIGVVQKSINPAWVTLDILTCVIPVCLCIPILIDAISGAWFDVNEKYVATMKPGESATLAAAAGAPVPTVTPGTPAPPASGSAATPAGPPPNMSESERKATARAAYLEGVAFQDKGDCAEALPKYETAQKFYAAPTHQLRIAQCQAKLGKLLEAQETYEALAHVTLEKGAPEAFKQAQDEGNKELSALKPRVPTLRVQVLPAASTLTQLVVKLNGNSLPNEVLGIARPVNPGHYKITAWAAGYKEASAEVDVVESVPKAVELKLAK